MDLTIDTTAFTRALAAKVPYLKKGLAESLNAEALKALIGAKEVKGAVQLVKKATKEEILRDLTKIVSVESKTHYGKKSVVKPLPVGIALAAKSLKRRGIGKGMTPRQWRAAVRKRFNEMVRKRAGSRAYIAAGFLVIAKKIAPAAGKVSGLTRMAKVKIKPGESAEASTAIVAHAGRLIVRLFNNARGSKEVGTEAMQQGLDAAARDMQTYVARKLEEAWKK